ncbi:MAG: SMC-Scp complex subunit ScpB [Alphaproteobacteria bacterium]|nr:SMC-Scp complex subunit ScpB [Alphaproteobacteria bacterium]
MAMKKIIDKKTSNGAKATAVKQTARPLPEHDSPHRIIEAAIFAAAQPVDKKTLAQLLPRAKKQHHDIDQILQDLKKLYQPRGVQLAENKTGFYFRTAGDVAPYLTQYRVELKKLSRAAMETLAIIAYHQPITRAEIETIRGVAISKGTLDMLLETGWIKFKGRRKTIGNPIPLGTTDQFLLDFSLTDLTELPGLNELKEMGLLQGGHDFSTLGMGQDDELPLGDTAGEQLDLLQNSLDNILQGDGKEEEQELLMDEPLEDEKERDHGHGARRPR